MTQNRFCVASSDSKVISYIPYNIKCTNKVYTIVVYTYIWTNN